MKILNAMSADPRVEPTHFRMFVRVLAALNQQTGIAIIADDTIADEVPGFKVQSTCNRARRALADLGYWTYESGRGTRATRYQISDKPVPAVLAAIDAARERREQEREERRGQLKRRPSRPAQPHGKNGLLPSVSLTSSPAPMQVVHPQGTPSSGATGTVQDIAHHVHEDRLCAICDSLTTFWHSASGNWICEKHRPFADEIAKSLSKDEDGFVDIVPELPAKIEDPDDFDDDIPEPSALRRS